MNDKYIKIHMINGKGYIWNADGKNITFMHLCYNKQLSLFFVPSISYLYYLYI